MSSKSSPFPYAKMRDRDMGIGGTCLDLSFPQVIGINSCIENKYLQVYRNQLQLFYGTLEPWLVCCCCLLIQCNEPGTTLFFLWHQTLTGCEKLLESRIWRHQVLLSGDAFLYFFEIRFSWAGCANLVAMYLLCISMFHVFSLGSLQSAWTCLFA